MDHAALVDRAFIDALRRLPGTRTLGADEVVPMTAKGVNHDHYRLGHTGLVARVPRATPWAGDAAAQLANEAAAFERAQPAGITPRLTAALPPSPALPRGALVVEEIVGRLVHLPADLPTIAQALARLHALPVPPPGARAPLPDHGIEGPWAATLAMIAQQRDFLSQVDLAPATRAALEDEFTEAERYAARITPLEQPLALVGTDTHPGNFLVRQNGSAVLVDLEKALYGSPAIDLAHASLPTSTRWDLDVQASLSAAEITQFYRRYLALLAPDAATMLRPWLLPCRRLTWLRTMLWFARWRVAAASSPDWSERRVDPTLLAHIRRHIAASLAPGAVAEMRAEWLGGVLEL